MREESIAQRALDAKHNFEQAFKHKDVETMNAVIDHLHMVGLSGLADTLNKRL